MNRYHTMLLDRLEQSGDDLLGFLGRLSAEEIKRVPAPGEWSLHAVLAHLRDTEQHVFLKRARLILEGAAPPAVESFDQDQWNRDHYSPAEPVEKIVRDFRAARRQLLKRLRATRDRDWTRYALHPQYGNISIEWLVTHNYSHMLEHLHQLLNLREEKLLKAANP